MAAAQGALALIISGGLIGVALSCTALAMTAYVRAVSEERRSMMLGLVSAAGSLGTMVVPLATQSLLAHEYRGRWSNSAARSYDRARDRDDVILLDSWGAPAR
jgi:MFS family permease